MLKTTGSGGIPGNHSKSTIDSISKPTVALCLLRSYYPVVMTMQHYLAEVLGSGRKTGAFLTHETDTLVYRVLLKESLVACQSSLTQQRFKFVQPMVALQEVIERAQQMLFVRTKGQPSNVITAGYKRSYKDKNILKNGGSRRCLMNVFVNTIVTALQAPEWVHLFQMIGEDAMFHILTETSIFAPLPNDCYCQMTGDPIIHIKAPLYSSPFQLRSAPESTEFSRSKPSPIRKRKAVPHPEERQCKRLKTAASMVSTSSTEFRSISTSLDSKRTPADISIIRARMFYFRPYYVPRTPHTIMIGLPPKHILNRLNPTPKPKSTTTDAVWTDPDRRTQLQHARHLAKYVFARQYGLPNAFVVEPWRSEAFKIPDYFDRELQIKAKGCCKTPERLKTTLDLLEKMIWRHGKCGYKALVQKVCPSKVTSRKKDLPDSSAILELMSEHSIQLRSQSNKGNSSISFDSNGRSILPEGVSEVQREIKSKPRFAEFACNHHEVFRFVITVTKTVIPNEFWGSDSNFGLICQHVWSFISARRYETLTMHHILQGFNTSECEWLMPNNSNNKKPRRVHVTDTLKRLKLLQDFLFWYFDSFVIPLLRTTFFVTESSAFRKQVLYFRQDDWDVLCAPLIERLRTDTFQKMERFEAEAMLGQRKLGFSFVRLLPKETGVRPIVNLRRKKGSTAAVSGRPERSINQILQAAFQVLTYEKEVQKTSLGASVFGPNEVYGKLKAFKTLLREQDGNKLPKLYFVKVDVQACFDTIEQDKLLDILKTIISEDTYTIQRYGQIGVAAGKIRRQYVKKAMPDDAQPHFLYHSAKLAAALRSAVFVDQVAYPYTKKEEVLALLEEHITENIVKIGEDYFRQVVGIPQGSVMSTLLCSFFYGDLERRHLKFTEDPDCVLLRLIDDYMLITTSPWKAKKFLDVMLKARDIQGHPEYGCFVSQEKTLANFEFNGIINYIDPSSKVFPWCGYYINMEDLSVSVDYSRFHDTYLKDSLTVEKGRRPGHAFTQKMLQLVKYKSHIVFSDSSLNTPYTVQLNIYQNFMLCAMKMHHYLHGWKLNTVKDSKFILSTIRQIVRYAFATMRNKAMNKVAKECDGRCQTPRTYVLWLGSHAFHTVLSRKAHDYSSILRSLEFDMSLPQFRHSKKRLRKVAKEGAEMLTILAF